MNKKEGYKETAEMISRKIRATLILKNKTVTDIAVHIGFFEVMDYIGEKEVPNSTDLIKIAKALDVSIDWLLTPFDQYLEMPDRIKNLRNERDRLKEVLEIRLNKER